VLTAKIAAQAEMARMSSFWRTWIWVRFAQRAGEQLVKSGDLVGGTEHMVVHVTEVRRDVGIDQAHLATDDGVQRGGQRLYGPREFQHLAFELAQPLGGLSPLAGEDCQLDLIDVAAYTLGGPPYSSTTRSATAYSTEAGSVRSSSGLASRRRRASPRTLAWP
jgi:hypothetical protein